MSNTDTVQKLRKDFSDQLSQATNQLSNLETAIKGLQKQQEQLRGAIYALDVVLAQAQTAAAPQGDAAAAAAPAADQAPTAATSADSAPATDASQPAQGS